MGAGARAVVSRAVPDVVAEYAAREVPAFALPESASAYEEAVRDAEVAVAAMLEVAPGRDERLEACLELLWEAQRRLGDRRAAARRPAETRRYRREHPILGVMHAAHVPLVRGTVDATVDSRARGGPETMLGAESAMRNGWVDFVERYTKRAESSPWHEAKMYRGVGRKPGADILVRTHFYILASQVLEAPYRPDALRAPLCWRFFNRDGLADFALEERMVEAAERFARERVDSINAFVGRPAFAALPLFLARVVAESRDASEIPRVTRQIRDASAARRFREHAAKLRRDLDAGEIHEVARELDRYASLLRREFGQSEGSSEVLWSLATTAAKTAALPDPAGAVNLAAQAGASGGKKLAQWWSNRKLALIAKTVRQSQRARSLQQEVRRLFGSELDQADLDLLRELETLAPAPPRSP